MPLLNKNKSLEEIKNKISSKKIMAIILGRIMLIGSIGHTYTTAVKNKD